MLNSEGDILKAIQAFEDEIKKRSKMQEQQFVIFCDEPGFLMIAEHSQGSYHEESDTLKKRS